MPSCPLMRWTWLSFVQWASAQQNFIDQFEADTGIKLPEPPQSAIDRMIDAATGINEQIAIKFIEWLNANHWGPLDMQAGEGETAP
ncbi:MAG TPA: hypothetical protein PK402_11185 [Tepidisphaeraceae bacterium]|nr:hypothetical protein [Tepidisphaeraceae bacterium]